MRAFEAAMDDDMNTSFAMTEFVKFVTKLNEYVAADRLTKDMADSALPTFNKIMDILGVKIIEPSGIERKEIEEVVVQRDKLRAEKKFKDADEIREKLLQRSVELLDHKGAYSMGQEGKARIVNFHTFVHVNKSELVSQPYAVIWSNEEYD